MTLYENYETAADELVGLLRLADLAGKDKVDVTAAFLYWYTANEDGAAAAHITMLEFEL
jgi:hypothetical protein